MSFNFEMISYLSSLDATSIFLALGSAAVAPVLGMAVAGGGNQGEYYDETPPDIDALKARAAELEGNAARSLEENEELADLYVDLAVLAFGDGEELAVIVDYFNRSEAVLKETLKHGEDTEIRRRLGNVYLHRAVAYNDYDELDKAIESYQTAIDALRPLEDQGDGEAKYDIAGIKLNRGTIYHELGDFDKAMTDFDESFTAFRAVEKISDLDTRFYMAKVSVAQGSLFRDMGEPLEKVVDAYNRAMRLFVELIDIGQMVHERDLATTLLERCTATYEEYKETEFESEAEKVNKFSDVLVDVGRSVNILEKLAGEDCCLECRIDLFNGLTTQGAMLLDLEKYGDAKAIFKRVVQEFADFADDSDPVLLNQFAAAYENLGFCCMNLDELEEALADFNESIRLCEKIQGEDFDLDEEDRTLFLPTLATYYANRANAHAGLGNNDQAKEDCQYGLDLIRSLKEKFDEDQEELHEIEELFSGLLEQWK